MRRGGSISRISPVSVRLPSGRTIFQGERCSIVSNLLRSEIIRKRSYLERWPSTARVDGVNLDRVELIIGENAQELAGFQLGPAHPLGNDSYSKPSFGATDHAVGGIDLDSTVHCD